AEGDPAAVVEFKAAIRAADGILIATPEYNDSIPGVLTTARRCTADGEAGRADRGVAEPDRHRARPAASPAAPRPRARAHSAASRAPGGGGARAIRSGAPAQARRHAAGSRGAARAICALDRPGAGR